MTYSIKYNKIKNENLIYIGGSYVTVKRNLNKKFEFNQIESSIYSHHLNKSLFNPEPSKNTFFIPMPPPNITGRLHIGHSLFLTIQDSLARFYRKSGYETLWLPGTDHAGLATHDKIIQAIGKDTYSKSEYKEKAAYIKETNQSIICSQIMKIGATCDWSRLSYTLDEKFKKASTYALHLINEKGLLYRKDNQWYISMKDMANDLISHINDNNLIINDHSELNQLLHMLENIEDWCISRQIPWGFELPINYDDNSIIISDSPIDGMIKETDIFDTWFTSSLWPFASLGWPEQTSDYLKYYPAQIIETGADILFFWCAKMLMMGKLLTGTYPFKEIYLHGICRDKNGIKMSKSLGNGIDPLEIIEKYGADSLRFSLLTKSGGKDITIDENDFFNSSKFINKIWQSFRFIDMHIQKNNIEIKPNKQGTYSDEIDMLYDNFEKSMIKRDFLNLTRDLQYSFKHSFCDKWIEENKKEIFSGNQLIIQHGLYILLSYMDIFNCFIPFISEYIFNWFGYDDLINIRYKNF